MNRQLLRSLLAGSGGVSATADRAAAPHSDHFLSGHHRTDPGRRSTESGTHLRDPSIRIGSLPLLGSEPPDPYARQPEIGNIYKHTEHKLIPVRSSVSDPGCLSRIRVFSIPDPNVSRICIKESKYFNPKNGFVGTFTGSYVEVPNNY
jgi:hypothetical protein